LRLIGSHLGRCGDDLAEWIVVDVEDGEAAVTQLPGDARRQAATISCVEDVELDIRRCRWVGGYTGRAGGVGRRRGGLLVPDDAAPAVPGRADDNAGEHEQRHGRSDAPPPVS